MCENLEFDEEPQYDLLTKHLEEINLRFAEEWIPHLDWSPYYEIILEKEDNSDWSSFIINNNLI